MTSEAFTLVYNKALDLVSRREHSRHELMQKLNKRFPETMPIIAEARDKLAVNNILDDERFAEMYLNSRSSNSRKLSTILTQFLTTKRMMNEQHFRDDQKERLERQFDIQKMNNRFSN